MAGEDEQRLGRTAPRPQVAGAVAVDALKLEAERRQALGKDFHAAGVVRGDGRAGHDLAGEV